MDQKDIQLIQGDFLEKSSEIKSGSVDMILTDLPYGVLNRSNKNVKWDNVIPFSDMWKIYTRVIKPNGAIVLFGQGMFSARLMMSNPAMWRYNLIWNKVSVSGYLNANRQPMRQHEDIMVFSGKQTVYNPQMVKSTSEKRNYNGPKNRGKTNRCYGKVTNMPTILSDEKFPTSIIAIPKEHTIKNFFHPTQKPVQLMEWLIRTYTNEGDTVFDSCMGSGSTGVGCIHTNRKFIGIELEKEYFDIASARIKDALDKSHNKKIVKTFVENKLF